MSFHKKLAGLATGTSGVGTALGIGAAGAEFFSAKSLQDDAQSFSREIGQNKYQWAIGDLEKAGLNPMLAISGGSGIGAGPPGAGTSSARINIPAAVQSAVALRRVRAEIGLLEAQGVKTVNEGRINAVGASAADQLLKLIQPFSNAIGAATQGYRDLRELARRGSSAMRASKIIAEDKVNSTRRKYWDSKKHRRKKEPLTIRIQKSAEDY